MKLFTMKMEIVKGGKHAPKVKDIKGPKVKKWAHGKRLKPKTITKK